MVRFGVVEEKYRPRIPTQRHVALARDGVDDCRVVALLGLIDMWTLGEITLTPRGRPMNLTALARMARRMRHTLPEADHTGGLGPDDAIRMAERFFPHLPPLRVHRPAFPDFLEDLSNGFAFSISGNAVNVRDASSPLHRTAVAHEVLVVGINKRRTKVLGYDPYDSTPFGEWWPVRDLRQFAFEFATGGNHVLTLRVRIGAAQRHVLEHVDMRAKMQRRIARVEEDFRGQIEGLRDAHAHELSTLAAKLEECGGSTFADGYEAAVKHAVRAVRALAGP